MLPTPLAQVVLIRVWFAKLRWSTTAKAGLFPSTRLRNTGCKKVKWASTPGSVALAAVVLFVDDTFSVHYPPARRQSDVSSDSGLYQTNGTNCPSTLELLSRVNSKYVHFFVEYFYFDLF